MEDVPEKQKLLDSIDKKIKWLELMKEIIDPLYEEIKEQNKQLENSRLKIGGHMSSKNNPEALKEAENYIRIERKWIAFKEINKQCQKIENGISFPIERGSTNPPCSERAAMASLIYASVFCRDDLRKKMKKARDLFSAWYNESSDHIALETESEELRRALHIVVPEIANYPADEKPGQTKEKKKLEKEELEKKKKKIVDKIAGKKRQEP